MRHQSRFTCIALTLVVGMQLAAVASAAGPDTAVRESFRFDPKEQLLIVPVRVGTKDYPFVVDTGCTGSIFDLSLRPHLGGPVGSERMRTTNGEISVDLFRPPDARVGSLTFTGSPVGCRDLTPIREASGRSIQGLLGLDFLKEWIVRIDFDEGRVDFLPPDTPSSPAWGECILFEYGSRGAVRPGLRRKGYPSSFCRRYRLRRWQRHRRSPVLPARRLSRSASHW